MTTNDIAKTASEADENAQQGNVEFALAPLSRHANTPLHEQIKDAIMARISSGQWLEGQRIPSENQLAKQLGVSRMTINRPLRELSTEGVLKRVHGLGTFVASQPRHASLIQLRSIREEIHGMGRQHHAVTLQQCLIATPQSWLSDYQHHTLACLEVVHYQDSVPIQHELRYVNLHFAPAIMEVDFALQTPTDYLISLLRPDEMEHTVRAINPDETLQQQLKIAAHEPCLQLQRRTWVNQQLVTTAYLSYPSSRYELSARYHTA